MLTERLQYLPDSFLPFMPCPSVQERSAWRNIPQALQEKYILRGEKLLGKPFAAFSMADWLQFTSTGERAPYEAVYFAKRRQLADLVMAECCEAKGRFMDDILNGIYSITAETAWWLPAHNTYLRDTPQLALPDTTRPVLELFSAETGALLALVYYLLEEKLDETVLRHVSAALEMRIITPYLQEEFWWMGYSGGSLCNWTPWCTQNVLLTAFCIPLSRRKRRNIVYKAAYSLDRFLEGYGQDGCCNEGAQYYGHAALALFGAVEVLEAVAPGVFISVYEEEKIVNMAAYILNMHVADRYYFNFADCSPIAGRRGAREYLFAKRTKDSALQSFAAEDYRAALAQPDAEGDIARINLWYILLEAFTAGELLACPVQKEVLPQKYYPSAGVFIARDAVYCLAAKAGNNGDSHNHNDTGSVILYKNGAPFLIDLGVETYSRKTFSPNRYEIWTMQSAWHNLPTFGGVMQLDGSQYAARDVEVFSRGEESGISMDIAPAYPPGAGVKQYKRTVALQAGKGVIIRDSTEYAGTVTLTLLTEQPPHLLDGQIEIGTLGKITTSAASIQVETVEIADARLRIAWPSKIYRLLIHFTKEIRLWIE